MKAKTSVSPAYGNQEGSAITDILNAINVVKFYNKRGTAEQWIKEGKYALNWT